MTPRVTLRFRLSHVIDKPNGDLELVDVRGHRIILSAVDAERLDELLASVFEPDLTYESQEVHPPAA